MAYHSQEPLGVIGQIIPWNFPILMASWQLAPALAAGNCVVLKPAEQTPASILEVTKVIADLLPPGVLNVVNGFAPTAGRPLEGSHKIARDVLAVALGLGAKSPNVFFPDVMEQDDEFLDKALEGFAMFCLNQGEVGTCPSRALIAESIYDEFIERGGRPGLADHDRQPARHHCHGRRPGFPRPAGQGPVLPRDRQGRGR